MYGVNIRYINEVKKIGQCILIVWQKKSRTKIKLSQNDSFHRSSVKDYTAFLSANEQELDQMFLDVQEVDDIHFKENGVSLSRTHYDQHKKMDPGFLAFSNRFLVCAKLTSIIMIFIEWHIALPQVYRNITKKFKAQLTSSVCKVSIRQIAAS